jgi:hypothetical protein
MNTAIITTIRHNIGDDFVREGILHLLRISGVLSEEDTIDLIHKHSPVTCFPIAANVRNLRASRVLFPMLKHLRVPEVISRSDLLVQSGAPIYWCHPQGPHCSSNEWFRPLVRELYMQRKSAGQKFLNLAGGSCQRYHSEGEELDQCEACRVYIKEFYDVCDLTIVRDTLAKKMLLKVGRDAEVLPCTSIFGAEQVGVAPERGDYIILNFMENGGHYTFGQEIDGSKWRKRFLEIAKEASKMGRVVIACHNEKEKLEVDSFASNYETFIVPNEYKAFIEFYAKARFGIVNRVHAGFMLASLGKPVAVIGTDSRARMLGNLNLPHYYVEDAPEAEELVGMVAQRVATYEEEIRAIRDSARDRYVTLIQSALAK